MFTDLEITDEMIEAYIKAGDEPDSSDVHENIRRRIAAVLPLAREALADEVKAAGERFADATRTVGARRALTISAFWEAEDIVRGYEGNAEARITPEAKS